jgi:hypothetical protein
VTMLQAGRSMVRIPTGTGNVSLLHITQSLIPWVPGFFQTVNWPGFDFDHPVCLVPGLRMGGATSLLHPYTPS